MEDLQPADVNDRPSTSVPSENWRRGWRRRVYVWAIALAVIGLVIGANSDLQDKLGVRGLLVYGLTGGWCLGALIGMSIEAYRARAGRR